jgi:hypothetical protein
MTDFLKPWAHSQRPFEMASVPKTANRLVDGKRSAQVADDLRLRFGPFLPQPPQCCFKKPCI